MPRNHLDLFIEKALEINTTPITNQDFKSFNRSDVRDVLHRHQRGPKFLLKVCKTVLSFRKKKNSTVVKAYADALSTKQKRARKVKKRVKGVDGDVRDLVRLHERGLSTHQISFDAMEEPRPELVTLDEAFVQPVPAQQPLPPEDFDALSPEETDSLIREIAPDYHRRFFAERSHSEPQPVRVPQIPQRVTRSMSRQLSFSDDRQPTAALNIPVPFRLSPMGPVQSSRLNQEIISEVELPVIGENQELRARNEVQFGPAVVDADASPNVVLEVGPDGVPDADIVPEFIPEPVPAIPRPQRHRRRRTGVYNRRRQYNPRPVPDRDDDLEREETVDNNLRRCIQMMLRHTRRLDGAPLPSPRRFRELLDINTPVSHRQLLHAVQQPADAPALEQIVTDLVGHFQQPSTLPRIPHPLSELIDRPVNEIVRSPSVQQRQSVLEHVVVRPSNEHATESGESVQNVQIQPEEQLAPRESASLVHPSLDPVPMVEPLNITPTQRIASERLSLPQPPQNESEIPAYFMLDRYKLLMLLVQRGSNQIPLTEIMNGKSKLEQMKCFKDLLYWKAANLLILHKDDSNLINFVEVAI